MARNFKNLTASLIVCGLMALILVIIAPEPAKAVVTKWWKVTPNTCAIATLGSDLSQADNADAYAALTIITGLSGAISVDAHCPVFLPHGVSATKLRIRTFQSGGIPTSTDVTVRLRRVAWNAGTSTLATAYMGASATYDDYDFTSTIDNENYEYSLHITLYKGSSTSSVPELDMIEIRYDE